MEVVQIADAFKAGRYSGGLRGCVLRRDGSGGASTATDTSPLDPTLDAAIFTAELRGVRAFGRGVPRRSSWAGPDDPDGESDPPGLAGTPPARRQTAMPSVRTSRSCEG